MTRTRDCHYCEHCHTNGIVTARTLGTYICDIDSEVITTTNGGETARYCLLYRDQRPALQEPGPMVRKMVVV